MRACVRALLEHMARRTIHFCEPETHLHNLDSRHFGKLRHSFHLT